MLSIIIENYLKSIFHLSQNENNRITTTELAKYMNVKSASITDMMQRLEGMDLVDYKKYQGVILTNLGRKRAIDLVRKHRLWEVFLVEKLQFNWSEVHIVAEQLEHIHSDKLIDKLENFLGNPKWDPHGDPIPDKEGTMETREQFPLADLLKGESATILGVSLDDENFLKFLEESELTIGKKILVNTAFSFDDSVQILANNQLINLSKKVAQHILVRKD
ncbi:MAG: metal-dependent transcriptional regulator [Bacteroidetes bacterium]|nr:metal-dependent transcriptional regulator [Bacteroidota bacterium]